MSAKNTDAKWCQQKALTRKMASGFFADTWSIILADTICNAKQQNTDSSIFHSNINQRGRFCLKYWVSREKSHLWCFSPGRTFLIFILSLHAIHHSLSFFKSFHLSTIFVYLWQCFSYLFSQEYIIFYLISHDFSDLISINV